MTELYTMDQMRDYAEAYHRSRVESSRADGGKGEAVYQVRPQGQLKWQDVEAISLSMYSDAEKYATRVLYTAPQAECAPREAQPVPWTYDQVVMLCETDGVPLPVEFIEWVAEKMTRAANDALAAPTPERAQPVGPRTTLNYDGTFDTTCAHCGGNGCFACLKSAAPTPERADADTATCPNCKGTGSHGGRFHTDGKGSSEYEPYKCDVCNGFGRVSADADKRELSWQEGYKTGYDDAETVAKHAAGASERADADTVGASDERIEELIEQSGGFWVDDEFRINCRDLTQLIRDASQERADAGKDAALLEALRKIAAIENKMYGGDWDEIEEARSIASIAILAANKETPERAAPRALTDESLSALFKVLMRRNIECGIEAYLTLRCVGVPPSEKDFLSAIEQAVKEPK
jgi:hypothetical protein